MCNMGRKIPRDLHPPLTLRPPAASKGEGPRRGPGTAYPHLRAREVTTAPEGGYMFAVRAPRALHKRLSLAATQDGKTIGELIGDLLDLRERFEELTTPRHPLARIPPISEPL